MLWHHWTTAFMIVCWTLLPVAPWLHATMVCIYAASGTATAFAVMAKAYGWGEKS